MIEIRKRDLMSGGFYLLSLYFIFEGLQYIFDNIKRANSLDVKLINIESYLESRSLLLFHFQRNLENILRLFIVIFGLVLMLCGCAIVFFDDKKTRDQFLKFLLYAVFFEGFVIHNPIVENVDMRNQEFKWFGFDILLGFILLIALGQKR